MEDLIYKVGRFCGDYRKNNLNMSLTDFCNYQNLNIKNVSAFEHGRANNIKYLYYYYVVSDVANRRKFMNGLFKLI